SGPTVARPAAPARPTTNGTASSTPSAFASYTSCVAPPTSVRARSETGWWTSVATSVGSAPTAAVTASRASRGESCQSPLRAWSATRAGLMTRSAATTYATSAARCCRRTAQATPSGTRSTPRGRAAGGDRDRHEPGIGRRVIRFEDAADVAVQEIAREREVRGAVGMDQRGAGDAGEPHHEADGERGEQGGIDA